ncbi:MAG: Mpo1-like protein [Burkholderiaceae bacterium]
MTPAAARPQRYSTFAEFYPFYLTEHSNQTCRRLHFVGTSLALACLLTALFRAQPIYILYGLLLGYGFAWIGHFGFEKNKPASFKQPLYSFMGDWKMWFQILTGKIKF